MQNAKRNFLPIFGKYRGIVRNNIDPDNLGRLQVEIASVIGIGNLTWALPCLPYAGPKVGFLMLPPMGASVWVEFEEGDPNHPIWSGCFWNKNEQLPPMLPQKKIIKTENLSLSLDDTSGIGGFLLTADPPAVSQSLSIQLVEDKIVITNLNGTIQVSLQGIDINLGVGTIQVSSSGVNINNGALEII